MRIGRTIIVALLFVVTILALADPREAGAARHRLYVGTITSITSNAVTIHSKTHQQNYRFVIDNNTRFLHHGQAVPRSLFHTGSYVTISYSSGPNNAMIAWHISLRK